MADDYLAGRGNPWDYDPGPPRNRKWPRLFSETPNYRGLGKAVMGSEKFRWHFGPMYYRGRLGDNQVKVLVVGQEGGQDEALSHRSFTGSSGSRMQHFLQHIGIAESYLFLNTFVYSIFNQYSGTKIRWLAQDPDSPIQQQRHDIFNYVLARNDVHLIIAVGTAAKESVATWVRSRGGNCPGDSHDIEDCDATVLGAKTKIIGVVHPGGAASGNIAAIKADFARAAGLVDHWADSDSTWLPEDPGATRHPASAYEYGKVPIPFRDLPLGVAWRLGHGSTTSNRKDSQRGIQIFSKSGKYGNRGHQLSYSDNAAGSSAGYEMPAEDPPYEPPVTDYRAYDRGPSRSIARLLAGGRAGHHWPDWAALGADAHPSFGSGPIYRGRPEDATVIVLADQRSHDDLLTFRALTGEAGQRFHGFLEAIGVDHSYLIVRVLPIDTLDISTSERNSLVDDPQVRKVYREIVRTAATANRRRKVLLAMGPMARRLVAHVNPTGLPVVEMKAWGQSGAAADWRATIQTLDTMSYGKDLANPSFDWDGKRRQIPRYDLPYGTTCWKGSSGDRVRKADRGASPSPDYFKLLVPDWVFDLDPPPLSAQEQDAITSAPE
ncbi:MAG: uracil-DNA glycosylase family protein [Acidimicrobiia bacterium]|nr:uracil-DNA glycosylase family protein [Acidimicrobiia bacterium]